jgi:HlyD family secretion protein
MAHGKGDEKRRRRPWLWAVAAIAVIALAVMALRPKPVLVDIGASERGPMRVTLDEEGETRVRDRYVVSAPTSGQALRITLEPGDPVVAGETILATFQPSLPSLLDVRTLAEAEARLEASVASLGLARAERDRSHAEFEFAGLEYERVARLAEEKVASQEQLDAARLQTETRRETKIAAEYAVRTAEHNVERARAALLRSRGDTAEGDGDLIVLRSPVDGVVLRRLRESASVVPAGEALIEVADPSQLEIVSDFLSEDAVQISPGAEVLIERWGGKRHLTGRVRRVEPSGFTKISALGVEEQRVNVLIDFEEPRQAWEALGDGFRVEVRVVIWERPDVLRVPTSSLFRSAEGWSVFTVSGGKAHLTPIEVGRRNGLEAEVTSGLAGGERIVVHPSDAVGDGVAVKERRG